MSKRTLVIGDIHGGYKALLQILEKADIKPTDKLIFLGDYVDGWSEPDKVIDLLLELQQSHNCIFIRGNHDQLLTDWLLEKSDNPLWLQHGGQPTLDCYERLSSEKIKTHLDFLQNLRNYYVDNSNRLFVHAGFTSLHGPEKEYHNTPFYWDRTLWETALALDDRIAKTDARFPKRLQLFPEIFIGHTPTLRIGKTEPVRVANITNVDTGAAFTGPLTVFDVESGGFWQSDPLPKLYPNEKGRN
ncbi:MAG: metallophosphoesterase family protein [Flavobacteriaceae bacterium]|nr:metallophosphoesterase family protein [Flavobacteriaceae bacterium]